MGEAPERATPVLARSLILRPGDFSNGWSLTALVLGLAVLLTFSSLIREVIGG